MCMNGIFYFREKSIYTLENKVLMHQCYIFQGSEARYPLKEEEVKVDDGLRKLAFLKPNIKLDNSSE